MSDYPGFDDDKAFSNHFAIPEYIKVMNKAKQIKVYENLSNLHLHDYTESMTFDGGGNEKVCKTCGEVKPTEITEYDKLSGCLDSEQFLEVRYGPGTHPALQSFLLPTIITKKELHHFRMKMRDKFVDTEHLTKTRKYTDIQRICQQFGIPNDYAVEVMRIILRLNKNIHSEYKPIDLLIQLIQDHPMLGNRVKDLSTRTRQGQRIQKLVTEIKELKKELARERKHHKKIVS